MRLEWGTVILSSYLYSTLPLKQSCMFVYEYMYTPIMWCQNPIRLDWSWAPFLNPHSFLSASPNISTKWANLCCVCAHFIIVPWVSQGHTGLTLFFKKPVHLSTQIYPPIHPEWLTKSSLNQYISQQLSPPALLEFVLTYHYILADLQMSYCFTVSLSTSCTVIKNQPGHDILEKNPIDSTFTITSSSCYQGFTGWDIFSTPNIWNSMHTPTFFASSVFIVFNGLLNCCYTYNTSDVW